MDYNYPFEKYNGSSSRYECPNCGQKEFTRNIYIDTGEYIAPNVGICNRKDKCGYIYTPAQYFRDNKLTPKEHYNKLKKPELIKPTTFFPRDKFEKTLCDYQKNHFVTFLHSMFDVNTVNGLIERYKIGTSPKWPGATIFWQQDIAGNIRDGKIMLYNAVTGKRVKDPYNHISWANAAYKLPGFVLEQCFFGEHLLKGNNDPVAIVEAEKTAIVASAYKPEIIWLAACGKDGLNEEKCKVLQGRKVGLYPDLKSYDLWLDKATELSHIAQFTVSDYLEQIATEEEREQGLDIADYLIRYNQNKKPAALFNSLVAEFVSFANLFAAGEKTIEENMAFTLEMERRLKENGIPLEDFVKATIEK